MTTKSGAVTLSPETILEWKEQAQQIESRMRADQALLDSLNRRIDAALLIYRELMPDPAEAAKVVHEARAPTRKAEPETLMDAVPRILREAGDALHPVEIKARLAQQGFNGSSLQNYLYTVLHRLALKGVILKEGKKYKAAQKNGTAEAVGTGSAAHDLFRPDQADPPGPSQGH